MYVTKPVMNPDLNMVVSFVLFLSFGLVALNVRLCMYLGFVDFERKNPTKQEALRHSMGANLGMARNLNK